MRRVVSRSATHTPSPLPLLLLLVVVVIIGSSFSSSPSFALGMRRASITITSTSLSTSRVVVAAFQASGFSFYSSSAPRLLSSLSSRGGVLFYYQQQQQQLERRRRRAVLLQPHRCHGKDDEEGQEEGGGTHHDHQDHYQFPRWAPGLLGGELLMSTSSSSSSSSSFSTTSSSSVDGTVYPVVPRAAVAITICTRPSAFGEKASATRYLLVQRGKDPGRGKWSLPGGSVELGEEILEAAAREAQEETGLERDALRLYHSSICTTDAIYRDGDEDDDQRGGRIKFHYVITHVAAWVNAGETKRTKAADDALDLKWCTLDEIKAMANRDDLLVGPVLDVIFKVEKMVRLGMINLDRDLILLPPPP